MRKSCISLLNDHQQISCCCCVVVVFLGWGRIDIPSPNCCFLSVRLENEENRCDNCKRAQYDGTNIAQMSIIAKWNTGQLASTPWARLISRIRKKLYSVWF